ncbi:MAG: hypothetical protein ABI678_13605, partial [Kofleriaceae bacterium]
FVVGSVCFVSCADKGDEGFFILNNTAPVGAGCTFTGDPGQPFMAAGQISVASQQGYVLTPLLESRITATMGREAQRTIHLEGANVTAAVANGGTSQSYTVLFSGSLAPNGGTTNVAFEALPATTIKALVGSETNNVPVIVTVTPYGTLGGGRIDGEPFQYPITIINSGNGIIVDQGVCKDLSVSPPQLNPCNAYQDGQIDCCHKSKTVPDGSGGTMTEADGSGALICPSVKD